MVIKADPIERTVVWRWHNALYMALGTFCVFFLIKFYQSRKANSSDTSAKKEQNGSIINRVLQNPVQLKILVGVVGAIAIFFPHLLIVWHQLVFFR